MKVKCDTCGTHLTSFVTAEMPIMVKGKKFLMQYIECPVCHERFMIGIRAGAFKETWHKLIDAKQNLEEASYYCPGDEKEISELAHKVEAFEFDIKQMVDKGKLLFDLINVK